MHIAELSSIIYIIAAIPVSLFIGFFGIVADLGIRLVWTDDTVISARQGTWYLLEMPGIYYSTEQ